VNLDVIGPRRDAVVAAKSEANGFVMRRLQSGPLPDSRVLAIGADYPAAARRACIERHGFSGDSADPCAPMQAHTDLGGAIDQELVQLNAPDAHARSFRKTGLDGSPCTEKTDAAQREALFDAGRDSEMVQGGQRFGHQPFAASFIDGRLRGVSDRNFKTLESRSDGRGQSGGPAPNHENVGIS
jgi:hypothetical protein